jgi:hypothetical protein
MGTNKPKPAAVGTAFSIAGVLLRPHNRGLVLTGVMVVAAIGGSIYAWHRWAKPTLQSAEYVVTPDRIIVTPQPTWVHSQVKTEVLRTAGASRLDLRDPKLVEDLAHAFALHPWIAKVLRVEKQFPAQVNVEVQYRRPVLVVKLDIPSDQGLLFLDEASVLLPTIDFAPSQAKNYLRVTSGGEAPSSIYGTPWGSERIAGAARLAAAWQNRWQPLGLYWIVAARSSSGEMVYELRTQEDKVRIVWGSPLGHESAGEPTAEQKIAALEKYVRDKGPLDREGGTALIDLRELAGSGNQTARQQKTSRR